MRYKLQEAGNIHVICFVLSSHFSSVAVWSHFAEGNNIIKKVRSEFHFFFLDSPKELVFSCFKVVLHFPVVYERIVFWMCLAVSWKCKHITLFKYVFNKHTGLYDLYYIVVLMALWKIKVNAERRDYTCMYALGW